MNVAPCGSLITANLVHGASTGPGTGPLFAFDGRAPRVERAFVAPTACVVGEVDVAPDAGIWFACEVRANGARIVIGPRSNVQDNALLETDAARGDLLLGADVTVRHNVRMGACAIEDECLIGMGCELGDGAVVERGGCVEHGSDCVVRNGLGTNGRRQERAGDVEV